MTSPYNNFQMHSDHSSPLCFPLINCNFILAVYASLFVLSLVLIETVILQQGEAFVPESIVRFGSRADGRDGVQTLKAEDERIKLVTLSLLSVVSHFQHDQF